MAETHDDLDARRWFRQRLAWLARQYPELHDPAHQQRLDDHLQEDPLCREHPPESREDAP